MSYWLGGLLAIIFAPITIYAYIQKVKDNNIKEINWFLDILERKEKLNEEEKQFIMEAKKFLSQKC
jgi:predicted DNA-binding transcriptional regulator